MENFKNAIEQGKEIQKLFDESNERFIFITDLAAALFLVVTIAAIAMMFVGMGY
jgi:hypothetical protein